MCYSAQALHDYKKFKREFDAAIGIKEYIRIFWDRKTKGSPHKFPKAMLDAFADAKSGDEGKIHEWIEEWKAEQVTAIEQELFAQKKRLADAERTMQTKVTKNAQNHQRIAIDKISKAKLKLSDLRRTEPLDRDSRFFPGNYGTVMVSEDGKRVVYPMRYLCRPAGKPANYDVRYPGTYNARRDGLVTTGRICSATRTG